MIEREANQNSKKPNKPKRKKDPDQTENFQSSADSAEESEQETKKINKNNKSLEIFNDKWIEQGSKKFRPGIRKLENNKLYQCNCQINFEEYFRRYENIQKDELLSDQQKEVRKTQLNNEYFQQKQKFSLHNWYSHKGSKGHLKFVKWFEEKQKIKEKVKVAGRKKKYQKDWEKLDDNEHHLLNQLRYKYQLVYNTCKSSMSFNQFEIFYDIFMEDGDNILIEELREENMGRQQIKNIATYGIYPYMQEQLDTILGNEYSIALQADGTPLMEQNLWATHLTTFIPNHGTKTLFKNVLDYSESGKGIYLYQQQQDFFTQYRGQIIQFIGDQGTGTAYKNQKLRQEGKSISYAGQIQKDNPDIKIIPDSLHIISLSNQDGEKVLPRDLNQVPYQITSHVRETPKSIDRFQKIFIDLNLENLTQLFIKKKKYTQAYLLKLLGYKGLPKNSGVRWSVKLFIVLACIRHEDAIEVMFKEGEYKNIAIYKKITHPEYRIFIRFKAVIMKITEQELKKLQKRQSKLVFNDSYESYCEILLKLSCLVIQEEVYDDFQIFQLIHVDYDSYTENKSIFCNYEQYITQVFERYADVDYREYQTNLLSYYEDQPIEDPQQAASAKFFETLDYHMKYIITIIQGILSRTQIDDPIYHYLYCIDPINQSRKQDWKSLLKQFPQVIPQNNLSELRQSFIIELDKWYIKLESDIRPDRIEYGSFYDFLKQENTKIHKEYPVIFYVMRCLSCLKPTSYECEQYFSQMKNIIGDRRHNLNIETLNAICFIKFNGEAILDLDDPNVIQKIDEKYQNWLKWKKQQESQKGEQNLMIVEPQDDDQSDNSLDDIYEHSFA